AELYLEIIPGQGRVFLETFPLTKVTTQVSLRFAQQIACKELDINCADKDFFFTIKSAPGIVGGPSAGGAATVLVAAVLKNLTLRQDIAMTGTINSGGLIGPVGGVGDKIHAGANAGLKLILIPKGTEVTAKRKDNTTVEFEDIGSIAKEIKINITEVSTFGQALKLFTGHEIPEAINEFTIDQSYQTTMQSVAEQLCSRTSNFLGKEIENETKTLAENLSIRAKEEYRQKRYYASASYCFRANTLLSQEIATNSSETIAQQTLFTKKDLQEFSDKTNARELQTISDLQTYMMVRERLQEASDLLEEVTVRNYTAGKKLAYAQERFESAKTWALFFNGKDKHFLIDEERMKHSCEQKIAEADERYNYVQNYFPNAIKETEQELIKAQQLLNKKEYAHCLFTSAKIKADSDAIISLLGVKQTDVDSIIQTKLNAVKRALIRSQEKGIFPLIGYSYYEYANSLKNTDKNTAILFTEYALELSNLDIYFPEQQNSQEIQSSLKQNQFINQNIFRGVLVGAGIISGVIISTVYHRLKTPARARKPLRGKKR
ncbi:MAG: S16 family serine protease, partial [Candidatus Woesearchaeota archaeon]|nr:S16 family serine protease [Candidatus Woesearchaeota archaeon]